MPHIAVKCNLSNTANCCRHYRQTCSCKPAVTLITSPLSSLRPLLSGLVSSRATSSAARSGARSSTSARGRGKTTCTQNRPRRRYSTCSHRRERTRTPKLLNTPCPSLEAGSQTTTSDSHRSWNIKRSRWEGRQKDGDGSAWRWRNP